MPENFLPVTINHAIYLNDLCQVINDWATKKGWNDGPDGLSHKAEQIALMHSELSECLEFLRMPRWIWCLDCSKPSHILVSGEISKCTYCGNFNQLPGPAPDDHVPSISGESAELADVLIRIFHYCGKRGIDLGEAVRLKHEYNITRPYRHGKNC